MVSNRRALDSYSGVVLNVTAEATPVTMLELARRCDEAGFPPGVINVLTGAGRELGAALVEHPEVAKVSFTGSTGTGIAVGRSAASHLAPADLELGGKSANVVFEDADLEAAANGVVAGIFAATGQTCVAPSRHSTSPLSTCALALHLRH